MPPFYARSEFEGACRVAVLCYPIFLLPCAALGLPLPRVIVRSVRSLEYPAPYETLPVRTAEYQQRKISSSATCACRLLYFWTLL